MPIATATETTKLPHPKNRTGAKQGSSDALVGGGGWQSNLTRQSRLRILSHRRRWEGNATRRSGKNVGMKADGDTRKRLVTLGARPSKNLEKTEKDEKKGSPLVIESDGREWYRGLMMGDETKPDLKFKLKVRNMWINLSKREKRAIGQAWQ